MRLLRLPPSLLVERNIVVGEGKKGDTDELEIGVTLVFIAEKEED